MGNAVIRRATDKIVNKDVEFPAKMPDNSGKKRSSGPYSEGQLPYAIYRFHTSCKKIATTFRNSAEI
jgi:hypothetical protein